MALNNIARSSVRLMQEFTTMPFRVAQNWWSEPNQSNSTATKSIGRSLNIMEQLTAMPFQVALDFLEPTGNKSAATGEQQQSDNLQSQLYGEDRDYPRNVPPGSE